MMMLESIRLLLLNFATAAVFDMKKDYLTFKGYLFSDVYFIIKNIF
jgi:hypothetical protein